MVNDAEKSELFKTKLFRMLLIGYGIDYDDIKAKRVLDAAKLVLDGKFAESFDPDFIENTINSHKKVLFREKDRHIYNLYNLTTVLFASTFPTIDLSNLSDPDKQDQMIDDLISSVKKLVVKLDNIAFEDTVSLEESNSSLFESLVKNFTKE